MLLPEIRNAVRALVIQGGRVLLLKKSGGPLGLRYALPGGGQQPEETLAQALQRECLEEIGTEVEIVRLLHVADYYKQRATEPATTRHLVEFLFACQLPSEYIPANGHKPDKHQIGVEWSSLDELSRLNLFPPGVLQSLNTPDGAEAPVYLGEIK